MASIPPQRTLPSKEAAAFRLLYSQYEAKSMKKAIKTADSILQKFPNHGETLSIKALAVNSPARRAEAFELVRQGVRHDITSHIVWHAFGLIQRSDRNFEEAIKCYNQALKCDKENLSLLRDFATLCAQNGNYGQAVELRAQVLKLRPHIRQHWIALVMALDLAGEPSKALNVLDAFLKTIKNPPNPQKPSKTGSGNITLSEWSELHIYYVKLLHSAGQTQSALQSLNALTNSSIIEGLSQKELQAALLTSIPGRKDDASIAWRILIDLNPENMDYLISFLNHKGLTAGTPNYKAKSSKVLKAFADQFPSSLTIRRLQLDFAEGPEFIELVTNYIHAGLERNIPSLFHDLMPLYANVEICNAIQRIVETYMNQISIKTNLKQCPPTTLIWTLYFLGQHHSHISNHAKAIELLDQAILMCPTLSELYVCKARALKRSANLLAASRYMEQARLLDEQDRYINCKAAKYWIAAGENYIAETILGLFTRNGSTPSADLIDMQAKWFLKAEAKSYEAQGMLHRALKCAHQTLKIFNDFEDDQSDFHNWAARKATATAYKSMLEYKSIAKCHKDFRQASTLAINIYCRLHDDPDLKNSLAEKESKCAKKPDLTKAVEKLLVTAPVSKSDGKAEKEAKKSLKKLDTSDSSKKDDESEEAQQITETDPVGLIMASCSQPLEEAMKLVVILTRFSPQYVEIWHSAFEVYKRKGAWLAAAEAVLRAYKLDRMHPKSQSQIRELYQLISGGCLTKLSESVQLSLKSVICRNLDLSINEEIKMTFEDLMKTCQNNIACILSVMQQVLNSHANPEKQVILEDLARGVMAEPSLERNLDVATGLWGVLTQINSSLLTEYKVLGHRLFPLAFCFLPTEDQAEERKFISEWSLTGDPVQPVIN